MTQQSDQDYHSRREREEIAAAEASQDAEVKARHRDLAMRHADRRSGRIVVPSWEFGATA